MLLYWIWFAQLNKLSTAQKNLLLQHFHDPEEIYHCRLSALSKLEGVTEAMCNALEDKDLTAAEKILQQCDELGIGIVTQQDETYPARLKNTYDPPIILYFKGTLPQWDAQPVIAIVGTRKATPYGLTVAGRFGKQIAASGALVVSGAAFGIDTYAMQGALQAGKQVVGVLGCGVDQVYPKSNKELFNDILQKGCLLSEYPPKSQAMSWHFPERNRIVTGISNGVLVVEAPEKSGAMISARHAIEQGRDVFAVPGNVDVPSCAGSNALLQDRAIPALSGWDVVKEYAQHWPDVVKRQNVEYHTPQEQMQKVAQTVCLPANIQNTEENSRKKGIDKDRESTYSVLNEQLPPLCDDEKAVLSLIGKEPIGVDEVIAGTDMTPGAVKAILTKLAIKRLTVGHPGGRISLK